MEDIYGTIIDIKNDVLKNDYIFHNPIWAKEIPASKYFLWYCVKVETVIEGMKHAERHFQDLIGKRM